MLPTPNQRASESYNPHMLLSNALPSASERLVKNKSRGKLKIARTVSAQSIDNDALLGRAELLEKQLELLGVLCFVSSL